jgi:hypothetical protein
MKKGGLTAEMVEARLREFSGNMAAVARQFGVTRQAVQDFVRRRVKLQQVANDVRESMKDHAESSLYKAVLDGEAWAVCFFLKTQARDRGYVEVLEGGAKPLLVKLVRDDNFYQNADRVAAARDGPSTDGTP